tara:strand:- start:1054 stop:1245 length:192 start_codon:yes stop_codon:yes gene_type:complete
LLSFVAPYRGIERRWTSSIEEKLRALLPGVGEREKLPQLTGFRSQLNSDVLEAAGRGHGEVFD